MTQQEEMKVLFPESSEVSLKSGEVITIKPLTFGQTLKAIEIGKNLGTLIIAASEAENPRDEVIGIMAHGGQDLIALLAFALKKDIDWFDQLPADEGVTLTAEFLGVNFDFFTKKVMPEIMKSMTKFKSKASKVSGSAS